MESGNLMIHVPLGHLLRGNARTIHWQIRDAAVTLHDASGKVGLEQVSLGVEATSGEIRVRTVMASKAGLAVTLHGTIRASKPTDTNGTISFDWQPVRTTLAALDVAKKNDPFRIFTSNPTSLAGWLGHITSRSRRWDFAACASTRAECPCPLTEDRTRHLSDPYDAAVDKHLVAIRSATARRLRYVISLHRLFR